MHLLQPERQTRRAFMRRSAQLAITGAALPLALNLAAMIEAAALQATDYKALVCVFLYGGSDYANTVVSYDDPSYNAYHAIRGGSPGQASGGIALARVDLAATLLSSTTALAGGRQYALNPAMGALAGLFNSGQAAVQLNVGPLVVPLTRAQYNSANRKVYPLPPRLFSHNDQQSVWQSSSPEGSRLGWGGNLGDLALSSNGNQSMFTCISLTGNGVFLSGESAHPYRLGTDGVIKCTSLTANVYGSSATTQAMVQLVQQPRSHLLENEYNCVMLRAMSAQDVVTAALAGAPANATPFNAFASPNGLADQLKMVARLIAARGSLGVKRQVFLVGLGGFDLHDNLVAQQAARLQSVSAALSDFYNATAVLGVARQVTAFTASDFGRTLSSNGDGSDHGWGSHHFVVGGAVRGKAFYGTAPPVSVSNTGAAEDQWHVGQGRLLPSTSVDQYAATLAAWFGVADAELAGILPNLRNFGAAANRPDYPVNPGFMA